MRESVEFNYVYRDDDDEDCKEIRVIKRHKDSLTCEELCEAFVDFMESAGFSISNVYEFFEE